ncbi:Septin ring organizing protein mid2 [Schizosaccharomyces pombe]|uniref:Septin ring organizing protein mid2 n=1 Tax=Schizosaccharomyces pombe (strain 972 / ATCC 24843) TaxID=284812 RepID=MID2_SCHPO|nr:septin ring organizing protein [Schizosaccharomyces pombe]Q9P7Y8.2 RecName: Full=Septin ring organizing protein mid2 [Schizosaccharomyces pombe 972h-]CAB66312.2 medial ring protein Mid2 [Schizosaccharomyces pombe]|eukprot:NP_594704.2 septin ring organizing protein [Schizosaccharomyces pombe]
MLMTASQQDQHAKMYLADIHRALRIPSPIPSTDYECSDYASTIASISRESTMRNFNRSNISSTAPSFAESEDAEDGDSFPYDQTLSNSSSFDDHQSLLPFSTEVRRTPTYSVMNETDSSSTSVEDVNKENILSLNDSCLIKLSDDEASNKSSRSSTPRNSIKSNSSNQGHGDIPIPKKNPARSVCNSKLFNEDTLPAEFEEVSISPPVKLELPTHSHNSSDTSFTNSIVSSVSDMVGLGEGINSIASFGFSEDSSSFQDIKTPPRLSFADENRENCRTDIYRSDSIHEYEEPLTSSITSLDSPHVLDENAPIPLLPKVVSLPDPRFTNVLSAFDALTRTYLLRQNSKVVHATSQKQEMQTSRRVVNSCYMPESLSRNLSSSLQQTGGSGRLFVRLMEIRNLTIPLASGMTTRFTYTISGKHIQVPWNALHSTTKIENEYTFDESISSSIVCTLRAAYDPPKVRTRSTLGKVFSTNKRKSMTTDPVSEALHGFVSEDGTFGEVTINTDSVSRTALGRCQSMVLPIMNKWTVDPAAKDVKPLPRKVGELEIHVFFLPALPVSLKELPASIESAMYDLKLAEWDRTLLCDGYLCQQGGDCPYWRRRYFQLIGSKLVAFQQFSKVRRATIDLSEATHIVDDNHYSDEEELEGYLYFESGFRIIFSNGDYIDFYAETVGEKDEWMSTLRQHLGQCSMVHKNWTKSFLSLSF